MPALSNVQVLTYAGLYKIFKHSLEIKPISIPTIFFAHPLGLIHNLDRKSLHASMNTKEVAYPKIPFSGCIFLLLVMRVQARQLLSENYRKNLYQLCLNPSCKRKIDSDCFELSS